MHTFIRSRSWLRRLPLLITAGLLLAAGGCATSGDSDMPWNAPQPWEGSPSIPGLSSPGAGY